MRFRSLVATSILAAIACGCDDSTPTAPVPPPATPVLLKDVVIDRLPSAYYHFEYDAAGHIKTVSFASGLTAYEVTYEGGRIAQMRNNTLVNMDRLVYFYDNAGRVRAVTYLDANGQVYTRLLLTYDGSKLTMTERERRTDTGFVIDKTMSFSYYADGNLLELTEHHRPIEGGPETTTVDRFEQYEDTVNVDGFGLIHDEFFDHLVLLPDVQLQIGNPAREILSGDGINYEVGYVYTVDGLNRPLTKVGDLILLNGPDAGLHVQTRSVFSYY